MSVFDTKRSRNPFDHEDESYDLGNVASGRDRYSSTPSSMNYDDSASLLDEFPHTRTEDGDFPGSKSTAPSTNCFRRRPALTAVLVILGVILLAGGVVGALLYPLKNINVQLRSLTVPDLCSNHIKFSASASIDNPSVFSAELRDIVVNLRHGNDTIATSNVDYVEVQSGMHKVDLDSAVVIASDDKLAELVQKLADNREVITLTAETTARATIFHLISLSQTLSKDFSLGGNSSTDSSHPNAISLNAVQVDTDSDRLVVSSIVNILVSALNPSDIDLSVTLPSLTVHVLANKTKLATVTTSSAVLDSKSKDASPVSVRVETALDGPNEMANAQSLLQGWLSDVPSSVSVMGAPNSTCWLPGFVSKVSLDIPVPGFNFTAPSSSAPKFLNLTGVEIASVESDSIALHVGMSFNSTLKKYVQGPLPSLSFDVKLAKENQVLATVGLRKGLRVNESAVAVVDFKLPNTTYFANKLSGWVFANDSHPRVITWGVRGSGTATDLLSRLFRGIEFDFNYTLNPAISESRSLELNLVDFDDNVTVCYDSTFTVSSDVVKKLPSLSFSLIYQPPKSFSQPLIHASVSAAITTQQYVRLCAEANVVNGSLIGSIASSVINGKAGSLGEVEVAVENVSTDVLSQIVSIIIKNNFDLKLSLANSSLPSSSSTVSSDSSLVVELARYDDELMLFAVNGIKLPMNLTLNVADTVPDPSALFSLFTANGTLVKTLISFKKLVSGQASFEISLDNFNTDAIGAVGSCLLSDDDIPCGSVGLQGLSGSAAFISQMVSEISTSFSLNSTSNSSNSSLPTWSIYVPSISDTINMNLNAQVDLPVAVSMSLPQLSFSVFGSTEVLALRVNANVSTSGAVTASITASSENLAATGLLLNSLLQVNPNLLTVYGAAKDGATDIFSKIIQKINFYEIFVNDPADTKTDKSMNMTLLSMDGYSMTFEATYVNRLLNRFPLNITGPEFRPSLLNVWVHNISYFGDKISDDFNLLDLTASLDLSIYNRPRLIVVGKTSRPQDIGYFINWATAYQPARLLANGRSDTPKPNILDRVLAEVKYDNTLNVNSTRSMIDIRASELGKWLQVDFVLWPWRRCPINASIDPVYANLVVYEPNGPKMSLANASVSFTLDPYQPIMLHAFVKRENADPKVAGKFINDMLALKETTLVITGAQSVPRLIDGVISGFEYDVGFNFPGPSGFIFQDIAFKGTDADSNIMLDIQCLVPSMPFSVDIPVATVNGYLNSSTPVAQAKLMPISIPAGDNVTIIFPATVNIFSNKSNYIENTVNSFFGRAPMYALAGNVQSEASFAAFALQYVSFRMDPKLPDTDVVDGGVLPNVDYAVTASTPDTLTVTVKLNVTFDMTFSVFVGDAVLSMSHLGAKVAEFSVKNGNIRPGVNVITAVATVTAAQNRAALEGLMSDLSFGFASAIQTSLTVTSTTPNSKPLTFPYKFVFPKSAAGEDSSLIKCSELADLSWSVMSMKLCKFTLKANSYITNPSNIPITIDSLNYDMLFDDPLGVGCISSFCVYDPKKNITIGHVREPGTLNPPGLPTLVNPGKTEALKVQVNGETLELCLRLNGVYNKKKLRLNIKNGKACVKIQQFKACIAFEILDYPIFPDSPPCFSSKKRQLFSRILELSAQ